MVAFTDQRSGAPCLPGLGPRQECVEWLWAAASSGSEGTAAWFLSVCITQDAGPGAAGDQIVLKRSEKSEFLYEITHITDVNSLVF